MEDPWYSERESYEQAMSTDPSASTRTAAGPGRRDLSSKHPPPYTVYNLPYLMLDKAVCQKNHIHIIVLTQLYYTHKNN